MRPLVCGSFQAKPRSFLMGLGASRQPARGGDFRRPIHRSLHLFDVLVGDATVCDLQSCFRVPDP